MPHLITKQGQNDPRKRPRESLRRSWGCHFQRAHAPPIQTRKQSLKLGRFQTHHSVLDRPLSSFALQTTAGQWDHVKLLSSSRL